MAVRLYARDYTGSISWDRIKLEKGNKATDWSPAPADTVICSRNYLPNGNFAKTYISPENTDKHENLYPYLWGGYNGGVGDPTHSYHAHIDNKTFGYNVVEFNESDGNKSWKGIAQYSDKSDVAINLEKVEKYYRISVDVFATGAGTKLYGGFYHYKKGGTQQAFHDGQFTIYPQVTNEWVRMSAHVPLNDDADLSRQYAFYIYGYGFSSSSILYIKNVSLTNSTVTTDWSPSKEEVDKDIEESAKTATNFMDLTSAGLVIGNRTTSTLNKNVLIGNDAIEFRDKTNVLGRLSATAITLGQTTTPNALVQTDGFYIRDKYTVLSSFKSNLIELGKNSPQSVIKLCGGVGEIKANNTDGVWDSLTMRSKLLRLEGPDVDMYSSTIHDNPAQEWNQSAYSQISTHAIQNTSSAGGNATSASMESHHEYTLNNANIATHASSNSVSIHMSVNDADASMYNNFSLYRSYGEITSPLIIDRIKFTGRNKVLWSGVYYMVAGHTATLKEQISKQPNGIVIIFSSYSNGAENDYNWVQCFVPKETVNYNKNGGHSFFLVNNNFSKIAAKYLYITDNTIRGHADNTLTGTKNGVTYANNGYVMRYVIGV